MEITLSPPGVLMLGKAPDSATIANVKDANSEIGIDIPAVATNTTTITAEGTSYKLTDISFNFVQYDLPRAVTDAMTAVLASGSVYQYWFPSHTSFMGQPVSGSKTGTTRIS